jgi:hypothetical protein
MKSKIKLNPGETLKRESSRSEGSMGQTDIDSYSILNEAGDIVGTVVHKDHTSINGFKRTQNVTQKDKDGNIIVQESW